MDNTNTQDNLQQTQPTDATQSTDSFSIPWHNHDGLSTPQIKDKDIIGKSTIRVYLNSSQSVGDNSSPYHTINLDTQSFIRGDDLSFSSSTHRVTFRANGYYLVMGKITYSGTSDTGGYIAALNVNGINKNYTQIHAGSNTKQLGVTVNDVLYLQNGDYIELTGGSSSFPATLVNDSLTTYLIITKL